LVRHVPPPRPEYAKLVADLPALAAEFGEALGTAARGRVSTYMAALECIDRHLDAIPTATARQAFGGEVLALLSGDDRQRIRLEPEVARETARLRDVLVASGALGAFLGFGRAALTNTELMRTTPSRDVYLECVRREGVLTVELTIAVLGADAPPKLADFLRAVAELGNLFDKLVDARGDHRRGELAVRPGVRLHLRLLAALLARVPTAAARHPSFLRFARWGLGHAWFAAAR
jgi:hypothetical protein